MKKKFIIIGDRTNSLKIGGENSIPGLASNRGKIDIRVKFLKRAIDWNNHIFFYYFEGMNITWFVEENKYEIGFSDFKLMKSRDKIKEVFSRG
jgi:hypothetical protein